MQSSIARLRFRSLRETLFPAMLNHRVARLHLVNRGNLILILIALLPFITWLVWQPAGVSVFWQSPFLTLAKFGAFSGTVLFGLNFVLATRWPWIESAFDGLDKVYKAHHMAGRIALGLLIIHPVAITLHTVPDWSRITSFYLPGMNLSYTFAQLSLFGLFLLIALTIWAKLPYQTWLFTHKLMGIPLVFGLVHALSSRGDLHHLPLLKWQLILACILGMVAYIYKLWLYRFLGPRYPGTLQKITVSQQISEMLIQLKGKPFRHGPGQFVFVSFDQAQAPALHDKHPFSIASYSENNIIRLSAKELGSFTRELTQLAPDEPVQVFGPYGRFAGKFMTTNQDMVWIGGGIGITPFLSMSHYELHQRTFDHYEEAKRNRKIQLYYSVIKPEEAIYREELTRIDEKFENFQVKYWYAESDGFLTGEKIQEDIGGNDALRERLYFLCGPVPMMRSITNQLMELGVKPRQIIFEEFSFD